MPNGYLNAAEKQGYVIMQGADRAIQGVLDLSARSMPKAVSGDVKRALYFLNRGRETWKTSVEQKSINEVLRIAENSNLGLVNNRTKHIMDAAEVTMAARCSTCDGTCHETCTLYAFYRHFEVEELDPMHPHCPYSGVME